MASQLQINGIGVSPGISIGRARVIRKQKTGPTGLLLDTDDAVSSEIERFDQAVKVSVAEVEALITDADESWPEESIEILETQVELLGDPQIRLDVVEKIRTERKNVNDALLEVTGQLVQMFQDMTDEYMRARSADVQDIGNRILRNLGQVTESRETFEAGTILIAEDISPSDTISMDTRNVIGFATQAGGKTSHAAIVARARGIPAVVGCGEILAGVQNGDSILLDGMLGEVLINPDEATLERYRAKSGEYTRQTDALKALRDVPAATTDGCSIQLVANISDAGDMEQVLENGGEGVGLLRSELLFMGRESFPTEDEQFDFYKKVALKSGNRPVTIRTIDIGGDKELPYFGLQQEQNPFLGYRAIRISLDRKDLFLVQLRAILRAGVFGDLRIMFPMISNIREVKEAKAALADAKNELLKEGIAFNPDMQVGIMIEIPSAAVMADILAKEVDFFSIGTNDLVQYTLAVDRMNEKVSALYDPFDPAVLRLIAHVIDQGQKNNIHVAMCGELAADPMATSLLLGMGLREFSMSAVSIPGIKQRIMDLSLSGAETVYQKISRMDSSEDIRAFLSGYPTTIPAI